MSVVGDRGYGERMEEGERGWRGVVREKGLGGREGNDGDEGMEL